MKEDVRQRADELARIDPILEGLYGVLARQLVHFRRIKNALLFSQSFLLISLVVVHAWFHAPGKQLRVEYWWVLIAYALSGLISCYLPVSICGKLKRTVLLIRATAEGTILEDDAHDVIRKLGDISQHTDPLNPLLLRWIAVVFVFVWVLLGALAILKYDRVVPALLIIGGVVGLAALTYDKVRAIRGLAIL